MIDGPFCHIESALAICEEHLNSLHENPEARRLEIESYLTAAMTLLIVSEYEVFIKRLFSDRANMCNDVHVARFVQNQISNKFRSPDIGKINEALKAFGEDYKNTFVASLENSPEHAAWDNIMTARHAVVHKNSTLSMTFKELKTSYEKTKK